MVTLFAMVTVSGNSSAPAPGLVPVGRTVLLSLLLAPSCFARENPGDGDAADKDRFTLFDPTPVALMRPMSADRPDKTESPYTVDAGHFQMEMDFLNYAYDRHNLEHRDLRVETVGIAPFNFKLGLCNRADLQFVFEPYTHVRAHDVALGTVNNQSGFGDLTLRTKVNLWGNDTGRTALAVMPFLTLPTSQHQLGSDAVEGGLIVPFSAELPCGWEMGTTTAFNAVSNEATARGHHFEYIQTITFSHEIVGKLSGYGEFFYAQSTESHAPWQGTFDCGLTYLLAPDIQLDAGINIGLTRSADDLNPFTGITFRF